MTYIIGAKYDGNAAIICDSRVEFDRGRASENTWLKSGRLFPGCMYAYSGSVYPAQDFIVAAKKRLTGVNDLPGLWADFLAFAKGYPFPRDDLDGFELLLTTRTSGAPELWVLNSLERAVFPAGDFVTLGSGKDLLDRPMEATYRARERLLPSAVTSKHPAIMPMNWCLQLMERAQGHEMAAFNSAGVGGYFHYSYQTSDDEVRQPPTLYVLCDLVPEKQVLATWAFRIAFCEASLVVECPIRQMREIILDPAAWPRSLQMNNDDLREYEQRINTLTAEEAYYNICGFGTVNPAHRKHNPMVATSTRNYLIDRTGRRTPEFEAMARGVFQDQPALAATIARLQMQVSPNS
jgi:hypothetical protein